MCLYSWEDVEENGLLWVEEYNKEKTSRIEAYKAAITSKKPGFLSKFTNYLKAII